MCGATATAGVVCTVFGLLQEQFCGQLVLRDVQALPPTSGRLLGFMWTSCASAQFVIVTNLGLKCFTLGKQALHSGKTCKAMEEYANADLADVLWHKYQHHSRILIMATQYDLATLQITGQVLLLPCLPLVFCHLKCNHAESPHCPQLCGYKQ
jgi:hypothetical protein